MKGQEKEEKKGKEENGRRAERGKKRKGEKGKHRETAKVGLKNKTQSRALGRLFQTKLLSATIKFIIKQAENAGMRFVKMP